MQFGNENVGNNSSWRQHKYHRLMCKLLNDFIQLKRIKKRNSEDKSSNSMFASGFIGTIMQGENNIK